MIDLREAIELAIVGNLILRESGLQPLQVATEVHSSRAFLDPRLTSSVRSSERRGPQPTSDLDGVGLGEQPINRNQQFRLGLEKEFEPGTTVGLSGGLNRSSSNSARAFIDPEYQSEVGLDIRQPLLRGFGREDNLADYLRAVSRLRESRMDFRGRLIDLIAEVEAAYYRVAAGELRLELARSDLAVANRLLEENQERHRLGMATRLEILQSEANVAERNEDLIVATQRYEDSLLGLSRVLGISLREDPLVFEVDDLPEVARPDRTLAEALAGSLEADPELSARAERVRRSELDVRVARRQVRPSVDLVGGVGLLGVAEDFQTSASDAGEASGRFWNVGIELSLPWDFRAERARYRSAGIQVERDRLLRDDRMEGLALEVRQAFRDLEVAFERFSSAFLSERFNQEAFEQQRAQYEVGNASFREVLEARRDLEAARLRSIESRISWAEARIRLDLLDGNLLARHGLDWKLKDETSPNSWSHSQHHHH